MNVKLLRKVQKHILQEPRRLDMNVLLARVDTGEKYSPPCGTVGCIAGWALFIGAPEEVENGGKMFKAKTLLGLDDAQENRLFTEPKYAGKEDFEDSWPVKFAKRYLKAKTAKTRAKVTSDRIDHFIKTKGAE